MSGKKNESSFYFQTIAHFFFQQRGSPFFLSSNELDAIAGWKEKGIPVQVALEGIRDCFAYHRRRKPGRKNKIHSLVFCRSFVLRAFEFYQERKVGSGSKIIAEGERKKRLGKAVDSFLKGCPEELKELREIFSHLKKMLSREFDEDRLERIEQKVERWLIRNVSESKRDEIRSEVNREYPDEKGPEHTRILELKIIKHMREKYKIPHISLYYY